jgi:uncharacterized iron-regulated membrane protein
VTDVDKLTAVAGVVLFLGGLTVIVAIGIARTLWWHRAVHARRPARSCGRCEREGRK